MGWMDKWGGGPNSHLVRGRGVKWGVRMSIRLLKPLKWRHRDLKIKNKSLKEKWWNFEFAIVKNVLFIINTTMNITCIHEIFTLRLLQQYYETQLILLVSSCQFTCLIDTCESKRIKRKFGNKDFTVPNILVRSYAFLKQ